jgi:hypothetical protein
VDRSTWGRIPLRIEGELVVGDLAVHNLRSIYFDVGINPFLAFGAPEDN